MRLNEASREGEAPSASPRSRRVVVARGRRPGLASLARLAWMRLARSRALLLAVALGMLVAVVLISTVPLYTALVANLQLQRALHSDVQSTDTDVRVQGSTVDSTRSAKVDGRVRALAGTYLTHIADPTPNYYLIADPVLLLHAGNNSFNPSQLGVPEVQVEGVNLAAALPHLHLLTPVPPTTTTTTTNDQQPQLYITSELARANNLSVGSSITLAEFGVTDHTIQMSGTVAAIWEATDANDRYWNGQVFTACPTQCPPAPEIFPILVSYDTFFSGLNAFHQINVTQHWIYFTQPLNLDLNAASRVQDTLGTFQAHVNGEVQSIPNTTQADVLGGLPSLLADVQRQQALLQLPLYVIVAQIVGLALLFVAAMAGLLVEGQGQEIATLKSRGLSGLQVLGIFASQGLTLGVVTAAAGPFLAVALALAMLRLLLPSGVIQGAGVDVAYLARIADPRAAIVPAIAGALLGAAVVAGASLRAARLDVLAFRREQARPARQPFWQRYYLDLALVALCVLGYLQLDQFGGATARLAQTGSGSSPLLLLAPALLLLAGALLVLRLIPLGALAGERLAARGRGLTMLLALSQVERTPGRYARIALLLVLAVGLGLFALTFDASLQQNMRDRAAYSTGADLRATEASVYNADQQRARLKQITALPGVASVTQVYRGQAESTSLGGNLHADLLVIDPATFGQVVGPVAWRSDYADQSLDQLLAGMRAHALPIVARPDGSPAWLLVSATFAEQMHVKPGDRFSLAFDSALGPASFVVGAIVRDFPTLYPERTPGGFVVIGSGDYQDVTATAVVTGQQIGPNEYWVRTAPHAALGAAQLRTLHTNGVQFEAVASRSEALAQEQANPTSTGVRGLLLVGAVVAVLLAVLGSLIQSALAARQRTTQFAILRTLGMGGRQLTGLLLGEQIVVYLFGLIGGTILGVLLTVATLPFLQFSDSTVDVARLGVPPYVLTVAPGGIAVFYAALIVSLLLALAIAVRYAEGIGLGRALRVGED